MFEIWIVRPLFNCCLMSSRSVQRYVAFSFCCINFPRTSHEERAKEVVAFFTSHMKRKILMEMLDDSSTTQRKES